jgi:hypothetical protein
MCCRTNDDPATVDQCAPAGDMFGLCVSKYQEIWRESCTDRKWGDGCLKLCVDPFGTMKPRQDGMKADSCIYSRRE